jgi:hypothetical protein
MGDSKDAQMAPKHKSAPGGGPVPIKWDHLAPKSQPGNKPATK